MIIFRKRMHSGRPEWKVNVGPWFCGFGSGLVDTSLTFPINKIMFRQQLNGITSKQAYLELRGKYQM